MRHKNSFIAKKDRIDYTENMSDHEKVMFYEAIWNYQLGNDVGDVSFLGIAWNKLKKEMDESNGNYEKICKQNSEKGKNHVGNQYTEGDEKRKGNDKAQKKAVGQMEQMEQMEHDSDSDSDIEEKEISKDISKKKNDMFETFRKEYPHARKGKKAESKKYYDKLNSDEVMKQVQILKRKLRAGLQESKRIPACERWIRDFTPLNDDVIKQDLVKICKWHLNAGGDMKQRSMELKDTFGEQQINEIVKAIQQKDSPKNLFIKQAN